jgi:hypothetical protein
VALDHGLHRRQAPSKLDTDADDNSSPAIARRVAKRRFFNGLLTQPPRIRRVR